MAKPLRPSWWEEAIPLWTNGNPFAEANLESQAHRVIVIQCHAEAPGEESEDSLSASASELKRTRARRDHIMLKQVNLNSISRMRDY